MVWKWRKSKHLAVLAAVGWLTVLFCQGVAWLQPARGEGLDAPLVKAEGVNALAAESTATPGLSATVAATLQPEPTPSLNRELEFDLLPASAIQNLQHILWKYGYLLPGQEEARAQTGVMDRQTRSAIRDYLANLYAIRAWTRDYFTAAEYQGLLVADQTGKIPSPGIFGSPFPPISTNAGSTPTVTATPTPAPVGIQILSPAAPADGSALLLPNELVKGLAVTGTAQAGWDVEVTLCSDQSSVRRLVSAAKSGVFSVVFTREECARFNGAANTRVTAEYPKLPAAFAAAITLDYHTARDGGAALMKVNYTHRDEELRIHGQVNIALMPLALQSDTGVELMTATSTKTGEFLFRLNYALRDGRPVSGHYRLILNGDTLRPETLTVAGVEQEALLPFTRRMSTAEVMWIGAALLTLSAALLLTCLISRRERHSYKKASRVKRGGENVGGTLD